jgi:hypothetical protein
MKEIMGDSDLQDIGKAIDVLNAKDGQVGGIKANVGVPKDDKKDRDGMFGGSGSLKKPAGKGKSASFAPNTKNGRGKKNEVPLTEVEQKMSAVIKKPKESKVNEKKQMEKKEFEAWVSKCVVGYMVD